MIWRAVKNEQSTPTRLGVAVALGVVIGCSPFYLFQVLLGVLLAQLLRLNKLAVVAGVQISAPPITPLVIIASVRLGHLMLYGTPHTWSFATVKNTPPIELLLNSSLPVVASLAVGGMTIGLLLAGPAGLLTAWAVKRRRVQDSRQPPVTDAEADALYDALETVPRRFRHYGAWKVRLDPVYPMALPLLAGCKQVVDLGAGIGLLGVLLHARFPAIRFRSIEWDAVKASVAKTLLAKIPEAQAEQADARTVDLGSPDGICLFDVLHYSPIEEQRAWVTRCVQALSPGGVLLIRELDPERGRWGLAEKIERRAVKKGWNQGSGVHAWPMSQLAKALRDLGLEVEVKQAGKGVFSANALVVARKPGVR